MECLALVSYRALNCVVMRACPIASCLSSIASIEHTHFVLFWFQSVQIQYCFIFRTFMASGILSCSSFPQRTSGRPFLGVVLKGLITNQFVLI